MKINIEHVLVADWCSLGQYPRGKNGAFRGPQCVLLIWLAVRMCRCSQEISVLAGESHVGFWAISHKIGFEGGTGPGILRMISIVGLLQGDPPPYSGLGGVCITGRTLREAGF